MRGWLLLVGLTGCGAVVFEDPLDDGGGGEDASSSSNGPHQGGTPSSSSDGGSTPSLCEDCLGGGCREGRCEPVVMATGFHASGVAIDQERVFVTSVTGEVFAGGLLAPQVELFSKGDDQALTVALSDEHVYFAGHGTTWRADKATGTAEKLTDDDAKSFDLALDGSRLLYSDYQAFGGVMGHWEGQDPQWLTADPFAHGFALIQGVKDWSRLYYFADVGLVSLYLNPREPSRTVLLERDALGVDSPVDMAVWQGELVWTQGYTSDLEGGVYRARPNGEAPTKVAALQVPIGVAVYDGLAYVTSYEVLGDATDGTLHSVDLETGQQLLLAEGLHDASYLAVDERAIYWIESDPERALMRLAR